MHRQNRTGFLLATVAALLWSPHFALVERLVSSPEGPSPLVAQFHVVLWGAALLMLALFAGGRLGELSVLNRREAPLLVLIALGGYGFWLLRGTALAALPAQRARLLFYTAPLLIGALSLFGRRTADGRAFFALVLGFVGCIMLVEGTGGQQATGAGTAGGHLFALASAACWAGFSLLAAPLVREERLLPVAALVLTAGAACLLVTCISTGQNVLGISLPQLGRAALGGAVTVGLATLAWLAALRRLPAVALASWWYLGLVFGSGASVLRQGRLGDDFWWLLGGTVLVLMALGSGSRSRTRGSATMSDLIRSG